MAVTGKALSAVTTTYATLQAGDIMAWERAGVVGKTTWAQFQTQDMTLTGTIDMSGATVTYGGPLDVLAGTSITSVSGADLALVTGTPGAEGEVATWNAGGGIVGTDLSTVYEAKTFALGTQSTSTTVPIDFISIPAGVNEIKVMLDGLSLSGTDYILVQIGDSGGVETTGYSAGAQGSGAHVPSTAGFVFGGGAAASAFSGCLTLSRMSGNKWVASGNYNSSGGATLAAAGVKELSAELDRVRITRNGTDAIDANAGVNISYR